MKKLISIVLSASMLSGICGSAVYARGFSDVTSANKAYEAINYLSGKGIVSGVGDNLFMPDSGVSRADFAVMADKALELAGSAACGFSDVKTDDYFYYAVARASADGIISGKSADVFDPSGDITREEAASILVRAFENRNGAADGVNSSATYGDREEVSGWAKEAVDKALALNLLPTDNGIEPTRPITRGEAARAITSLLLLESENSAWDSAKTSSIEQTTARGNIFTMAMKEKLMTLTTDRKAVEYVIRDFRGKTIEHKYVRISEREHVFDVSDYDPGYYELYVYARDSKGLKEEISKASFCVLEDYDFKNLEYSPFGVNTHVTRGASGWRSDLFYEASLIGVRHIRDGDEWGGVERQKGVYTDTFASVRAEMKKYNMDNLYVPAYVNPFYDHNSTPYTDDGRLGFANFCRALFDMWGDDMKMQEVYNEWWGPQFGDRGNGEADSLPETFVPLLKKVYEVVHEKYPDVILMPTFSRNSNSYQPNWNTRLFNLGVVNYIDAMALHGYAGATAEPEDAESIVSWTKDLRDEQKEKHPELDLDIYITETGANTSTNSSGISEIKQAWYVPRIFAGCMNHGVEMIWWYDLIDDGNTDSEHEDRFGIMRAFGSKYGNYAPKPAYVAYGAFARAIAGQRIAENRSEGDIYHYVYTGDGADTHVIYTGDKIRKNVTIYADSAVEVIDIVGGKKTYTPVDGKLYFTVSGEAFYVKGDIGRIEEDCPVNLTVDNDVTLEESFNVYADNGGTGLEFNIEGTKIANGAAEPERVYVGGDRTVVAEVTNGGATVGRISVVCNPSETYTLAGLGNLEEEEDGIRGYIDVTVNNNSPRELPITGFAWTLDDTEGVYSTDVTVPSKDKVTVKVPVGIVETGVEYNYTIRTQVDGVTSGKNDLSDSVEFNTLERFTPVIDGVVDEGLSAIKEINLDEGKINSLIDGMKYDGTADLGGTAWITCDDDNIYWVVDVTDDEHNADETGELIWRNDGLQIAFYCENSQHYDLMGNDIQIGISLGADGPMVWRWRSIDGMAEDSSEITGAQYAVTRDEATKHTVYEIAVPWSTLKVDPKTEKNIRASLLVNDNDKGLRKTFLEWGSGIGYGASPNSFIKYILIGGGANE